MGPPSGASLQRALQQVPAAVLPTLMNYVGDGGLGELERAAAGLGGWRRALKRGHLPDAEAVAWPEEPFRTTFAQAVRMYRCACPCTVPLRRRQTEVVCLLLEVVDGACTRT